MAIGDLPTFTNYQSASSTYNPVGLMQDSNFTTGTAINLGQLGNQLGAQTFGLREVGSTTTVTTLPIQLEKSMSKRRYVRVLVVDPNENIPLDQCVLYAGDEKLTDMDDKELFFDLDIKTLLANHNEKRVKVMDKKVKERTEYLEPAKIRDLKMVVVTVAEF